MKRDPFISPTRQHRFVTYDGYIRSLTELLKVVDKANRGLEMIFRGQREDLPLVPKIGRMSVGDRKQIKVRPPGLRETWVSAPIEDPNLDMEKRILEEFERKAVAFVSLPSSKWEVLAIAQHHGLPTRLLDWTYNPCVAAWFAVARPPMLDQRPGVIWIHTPNKEDYLTPRQLQSKTPLEINRRDERPMVFDPRHVAPRIRAQDGLFTLQSYNARYRAFRPVDRFGSHVSCMIKLIVPTKSFSTIRDQLYAIGINAATIYPDLDGLTRMISDAWTL